MSIPQGLRDVIGKRLSGLSQRCNRILSVAAVVGREFRLDLLKRVANTADEELYDILEEAKGVAVVEERSSVGATVAYRFTHAFFRQTLYEETIAPRRIQLHQLVARTLEEAHAGRLEEHAVELAEHFSHSSDPTDLAKSVRYGGKAAQRAVSVYAYGEAVRLLEQALKVQQAVDPEDRAKRCDVLLSLSEALIFAGEPRRALDGELPAAFSLAEEAEDSQRCSHACRLAFEALMVHAAGLGFAGPEADQWAERADQHADPNTLERAIADTWLGTIRGNAGDYRSAQRLFYRALAAARASSDSEMLWIAGSSWVTWAKAPKRAEERLLVAEELVGMPRTGLNAALVCAALGAVLEVFLEFGCRERAEEIMAEIRDATRISGQANILLESMALDGVLAALDGHLEDAVNIAERILARGEELGLQGFALVYVRALIGRAALHLGRTEIRSQPVLVPTHPLALATVGRHEEARQALDQGLERGSWSADDERPAYLDFLSLEAATLVQHTGVAQLLLQRLITGKAHTTGLYYTTSTARHVGAAAALLGRPSDARAHYQDALKVATDMRFRPEIALTRLQMAELLLEHYSDERSEAFEYLDFAIGEFREMRMQPSLGRALTVRKHR
jgi:tetratricopeptide (TPR) repeat protein